MSVAEVEEGHREGLTSAEREELVRLRRELRVARMEVETLKRASAYFARERPPKRLSAGRQAGGQRARRHGGLPELTATQPDLIERSALTKGPSRFNDAI